jgi:uncharacterized membrane protein YkvA (DUF1232 family)
MGNDPNFGSELVGPVVIKQYRNSAEKYLKNPSEAKQLLSKALSKAGHIHKGSFVETWGQSQTLVRMLQAYLQGNYKHIPWQSLVMAMAAIVYFVTPVDFIPDFILGLGLLEDAALLSWVVQSLYSDITKFQAWETEQKQLQPLTNGPSVGGSVGQ